MCDNIICNNDKPCNQNKNCELERTNSFPCTLAIPTEELTEIIMNGELTNDMVSIFGSVLDMKQISKYFKLDGCNIRKYASYLDWRYVNRYQGLSKKIIDDYDFMINPFRLEHNEDSFDFNSFADYLQGKYPDERFEERVIHFLKSDHYVNLNHFISKAPFTLLDLFWEYIDEVYTN